MARGRKRTKAQLAELVRDIVEFGSAHRVPEGKLVGDRWTWLDWEIKFLEDTFGVSGVNRHCLSIGRRNGKTALVSMLNNSFIYGPLAPTIPNGLLVSGARTKKQARIVFRYSKRLVELSGFSDLVHIRQSAGEIEGKRYGVLYQAISAEHTGAHGEGAAVIIHDELGRVRGPYDPFFEALTTSLGSYDDPLELIISSAAASDADLFQGLVQEGLDPADPSTRSTVYTIPTDMDVFDEANWHLANPSLGHNRTIEDVRRQSIQAQLLPAREPGFRNFTCNQVVELEAPFISKTLWQATEALPDWGVLERGSVYGGLDLSSRRDLTSLALAAEDEDGTAHLFVWTWSPLEGLVARAKADAAPYVEWSEMELPGEGDIPCSRVILCPPAAVIAYDWVASQIEQITAGLDVVAINYDRAYIEHFRRELDAIGVYLPLVKCGQGYIDMTPALNELENACMDGNLRHGGNPVLARAATGAVVTMDPAGGRKLNKSKAIHAKIDPIVAACMAMKALRFDQEEQSITESQGVLFVGG